MIGEPKSVPAKAQLISADRSANALLLFSAGVDV